MNPQALRTAFLSAIPSQNTGVPAREFIYVPFAHAKALDPDHPLVRGIRGAGKSVLSSVLQTYSDSLLRELFPSRHSYRKVSVVAGFGEISNPAQYPGRDTLEQLLKKHEPRIIWRTIILWKLTAERPEIEGWIDRVRWVSENSEPVEQRLYDADQSMGSNKELQLIVFDALDRTAATWDDRARLLDGLLENLLDFRTFRAVRLKAFVRPDMLVGPEIGRFPDASKILVGAVDLLWSIRQLFGLLFHYLGNAPSAGDTFRAHCMETFGQGFVEIPHMATWRAPGPMDMDETLQRRIFHSLAGEWMGTNPRRGYPYTWLPNHLADAHEQVSPRSFLAALREAAEETAECYQSHPLTLHYEAIKRGVQKASQIRVAEVAEDFPWIRQVMEPLKDLTVPCEMTEIAFRWTQSRLHDRLDSDLRGVLPRRAGEFSQGLCDQLVTAGIFARMPDGRINLPDVYRVGFGLRRLGGVKPLR